MVSPPHLVFRGSEETITVHNLHPSDIGVVMAMGDSVTAGFGIGGTTDELRGVSFSIGGDENRTTLPNFLKYFNPNLKGAARGSHIIETYEDKHRFEMDQLSAAQSEAKAEHLDSELDYLISHLKSSNLMDEWKILTIFIGTNDICASCEAETFEFLKAEQYKKRMKNALIRIKQEIPKVFVNILTMIDLAPIRQFENDTFCKTVHFFLGECACEFLRSERNREIVDTRRAEYTQALFDLVDEIMRQPSDSFAVEIQPFLDGFQIPESSYLSTFDCFHPSESAHREFAIALWNGMFEPFGKKQKNPKVPGVPMCPKPQERIRTRYSKLSSPI